MVMRRRPPTLMPATPWSQPGITWPLPSPKLERVAAVPRRVELAARLPRHADVVDLDDPPGGRLLAVADLDVLELQLVGRRPVRDLDRGLGHSQKASRGTPISVTLWDFVDTAKEIGPPALVFTRATEIPNMSSVAWESFVPGNAALICANVPPTPTPLAFAPPVTMIVATLRGRDCVRSAKPCSGARSAAARARGPASSQPRTALASLWARRSDV